MHLMKYAGVDEWRMEKARPMTDKNDRWWEGRIPSAQVATARGLCPVGKCVLKEGHLVPHWPE